MELRRRPGTERVIALRTPLPGLAITASRVLDDAELAVDGVLEAIEGAITITGSVIAPWVGECRRCLEPVEGTLDVVMSEVFEPRPVEGETYLLDGDEVDLEPVVRDAVLLHLPLAPLCSPDCAGPAPSEFSVLDATEDAALDTRDPRWAVLDELRFDAD